ncbi:desulfoferrodoxin family protein [Nautilia sp.]
MNRRKALKLGALGLAAAAVTPVMAVEKNNVCNPYGKYREKIYNRNRYHISENPSKGELKHTPEIKIGSKDTKGYTLVEITIGQKGIIHPSSEDHWIDFIELRADGKLVERVLFEPGKAMGYAAFKVKLDGVKTLTAVEGCNKHGIWDYTITL